MYKKHKPHILLLDVNLPKLSGIELLQRVREHDHTTRAVMLSAYSDVELLLKASELKLTKYIIKPLSRESLSEAIEMLVNEMSKFQTRSLENLILPDGYQWSYEKCELTSAGTLIHLTPREKKVFALLAQHSNSTLDYDDIIYEVWGDLDTDRREALKTTLKTLRKKLPAGIIKNIFGEGYKLQL